MPNHYHLLLEIPEANLSRIGQWLNVSYSVWFNRRHRRSGHLFQGRFAAILLEDDRAFQEVGRYLHLNPVRVMRLGLGKADRPAGKSGLSAAPSVEVVRQRLATLRQWRWSSYPAYAGYASAPPWLTVNVLGGLCGGRNEKERRAALRAYTQEAVRQGLAERPWERVVGGAVLGSAEFVQQLSERLKGTGREQPGYRQLKALKAPVAWPQIVQAVEEVKGERWADFCDRYRDWGRDAALWLGRRRGRLRLGQLAELAGGLDYAAVAGALSRFQRRLTKEVPLQIQVRRIENQLSNI